MPGAIKPNGARRVDERGFWRQKNGPGRLSAWSTLFGIVLSLSIGGCQLPQVPEYKTPPPPSAVRIAYLDSSDLHMMQVDGTDVTSLANNLQPTQCAPYYVAPDGHWIVYQQADDGLWVTPTTSGSAAMLKDAMTGSVSWFPDSKGIIYTLDNDVYAQLLDSSQPAQALIVGGRRYFFPTWSPDGKYIALLETTGDPNIFNVVLIESDGSGWRTLGTTAPQTSPRQLCPDVIDWSPDSTRLLVDFGEPAFVYYVAGGSPVQMGSGPAPVNHAWSPDGHSLTYQDESGRLWVVGADGSGHKLLTGFPVGEAVWSPQANQVAYIAERSDGISLEIIDIDSGEVRSLTSGDAYVESSPRWTPDGAFLIFARYLAQGEPSSTSGPESAGIWRVRADGSAPPQRLTTTGDALEVFAIR